MKRQILLLFSALGFFSLLSQTLIIREFIISFDGNELAIGIFYFFWLFWVGIGAQIAIKFGKHLYPHFFKIISLYPFLALGEILLFIALKLFAGIQSWEFFPFEEIEVFLYGYYAEVLVFLFHIFKNNLFAVLGRS